MDSSDSIRLVQMTIYIHSLMKHPNDNDTGILTAVIDEMRVDRVFKISLADIDRPTAFLSRCQPFKRFDDLGVITLSACLIDQFLNV